MQIDFSKLDFEFSVKPLLVGGRAMKYYGLRKSGGDTDLIVVEDDYLRLAKKYPESVRNLGGDLGVCVYGFEIWRSITLFRYDFLSQRSLEIDNCRVIALDRLLLIKALAMYDNESKSEGKFEKYKKDVWLISQKIEGILIGEDKNFSPKFFQ